MASGPSEIILLIAGLIVAGLVSGVLLETWDDMDRAIGDRGKEGAEDVRTRASLVNDPSNMPWDDTEKTATVHIQNSGETLLSLETVGVFIDSFSLSVSVADSSTEWVPGQIVKFTIDDTSDTLSYTGTNDVIMTITVVSTATGYAGAYTVSEEVRLVTT
jgi:archaellum component FlaG (FlaF/FlaG flagellin family)